MPGKSSPAAMRQEVQLEVRTTTHTTDLKLVEEGQGGDIRLVDGQPMVSGCLVPDTYHVPVSRCDGLRSNSIDSPKSYPPSSGASG